MAIREAYRTSIDHPFNSSKGRLDGYPGSLPNKYSPTPLTPSRGGLMVIREVYRTSIAPPL